MTLSLITATVLEVVSAEATIDGSVAVLAPSNLVDDSSPPTLVGVVELEVMAAEAVDTEVVPAPLTLVPVTPNVDFFPLPSTLVLVIPSGASLTPGQKKGRCQTRERHTKTHRTKSSLSLSSSDSAGILSPKFTIGKNRA